MTQADLDLDSLGDACDADDDGDGVADTADNCPTVANANQRDTDSDGTGNLCDADDDGDGVYDTGDNCPLHANPGQTDTDSDGRGNACDTDDDGDGERDAVDNCPLSSNADQLDTDGDGSGDACDLDDDGDGVNDTTDECAGTTQGHLVDPSSGCSIAQLCPCAGPKGASTEWDKADDYVSCVKKAASAFQKKGLLVKAEVQVLGDAATASECGQNPCRKKTLKHDASKPRQPVLVIEKVSFGGIGTGSGPGWPAFRVFAGDTEVKANTSGEFLIPLRDGSGAVITDTVNPKDLQRSGIPNGSYVVLRRGSGVVVQGFFGDFPKVKKSTTKTRVYGEVVSDYGAAPHSGPKNLTFDQQGDGFSALGNARQDEFYREPGQLRIQATVDSDVSDLVESAVCQ